MEENKLDEIAEQMISRYSKRYNELGYNVKTLGWGSKEQQDYRFFQTLSELDFDGGKSVIDIGCGFGDYFALLLASNKKISQYTGWDINGDLISEAQKIWSGSENASFAVKNISTTQKIDEKADIAVMLGVLNLNLNGILDNYEYSFRLIKNAFECVNEVLVVDFLSTQYTAEYPVESFVFYHDPVKMLEFALTLSSNVVLKHNYSPIPQKEFMLFIYK